jgi:hypothetical protein
MNKDLKIKLGDAIKEHEKYFILNEPLNDELIYQTIYEIYFKNITLEDIRGIVNISFTDSSNANYHHNDRAKTASIKLDLKTHFSINDRIEMLDNLLKI